MMLDVIFYADPAMQWLVDIAWPNQCVEVGDKDPLTPDSVRMTLDEYDKYCAVRGDDYAKGLAIYNAAVAAQRVSAAKTAELSKATDTISVATLADVPAQDWSTDDMVIAIKALLLATGIAKAPG